MAAKYPADTKVQIRPRQSGHEVGSAHGLAPDLPVLLRGSPACDRQ